MNIIDADTVIADSINERRLIREVELQENLVLLCDVMFTKGYKASEIAGVMRCVIADYLEG